SEVVVNHRHVGGDVCSGSAKIRIASPWLTPRSTVYGSGSRSFPGTRRWHVRRLATVLVVAGSTLAATMAAAPSLAAAPSSTPRSILHIDRYPGGISNGVRAMVSPRASAARAASDS